VNRYRFIEAEKAEQGNVAKACDLLEVSRSAFYDWHHHRPSARQLADIDLGERIGRIFDESGQSYGWPRVHRQLRRQGVQVGRARVARIMRQRGLVGRCRRPKTRTTFSDPEAQAVDLIKRAFGPGTVEVDRVYVGDITYSAQLTVMCSGGGSALMSRWPSGGRAAHNHRCSRNDKRRSFGRNRAGAAGLGSPRRLSVASL
jgi:hypothetical protein